MASEKTQTGNETEKVRDEPGAKPDGKPGSEPKGELTVRITAMPADANANGDIFGGWVMSQMDLAAGARAAERTQGRVATAAVEGLSFKKPVHIGDILCVYSTIERVGRTSITLDIEAWAKARTSTRRTRVTEAKFVMVAIDADGRPCPIPEEPS